VGGYLLAQLPVPLALARPFLLRDNAYENDRDGWNGLSAPAEEARYIALRSLCREYAPRGRLLDVGCSQGLLQIGLDYGVYVGIDSHEVHLVHARQSTDERTSFVSAEEDTYVPPETLDVIVLNEVLYYLPRPVATVRRLARYLAPGGVLLVSMTQAWATRRITRQLTTLFPVERTCRVAGPSSLVWTLTLHRQWQNPCQRWVSGS